MQKRTPKTRMANAVLQGSCQSQNYLNKVEAQ